MVRVEERGLRGVGFEMRRIMLRLDGVQYILCLI